MITKEKIAQTLETYVPREKIGGIVINGNAVGFSLEAQDETLRLKCEKAVFALPGVEKVTAVLTGTSGQIKVSAKNTEMLNRRASIPGVKRIIAVASGKGGTGKSTIAVNFALAAAALGIKTALVDADIYGPSVPLMMGLGKEKQKPELIEGKMKPLLSGGVYCNSIGFLIDESTAAIWRGPMATKALHQLLLGTAWEDMDLMFIDFPPGTGDIQLSLAQNYKIDGAILVTTPQEIALADVRKAAQMFSRVEIPLLGVVENMSYYADETGKKYYIFGQGGGRKLADDLNIPLLGEIPLDIGLRQKADEGELVATEQFQTIIQRIPSA